MRYRLQRRAALPDGRRDLHPPLFLHGRVLARRQCRLCAPCAEFGSNIATCDSGGALSCTGGSVLYDRECHDTCPAETYPASGTCWPCGNVQSGNRCALSTAESCGYLFDERLGACSNFCPTYSDGGNTPGSYVDGSTCKSCGDATQIDSCDASGAITCRAPFVKVGNSCISAATCVAIGPTIYTGYVPSGRGYDIGYCWHCAEGEVRNESKTGCVSQPRGT